MDVLGTEEDVELIKALGNRPFEGNLKNWIYEAWRR